MTLKPRVGVLGSATAIAQSSEGERLRALAHGLGHSIAERDLTLFTGATTGLVYEVGNAARTHGAMHIGISPASSREEHVQRYKLPTEACREIVYTGFGLKGRNVVLVRSCDIVLFVAGGMGSLNEFTIAHDERKIIGCFSGTGGVADNADYLLAHFSKSNDARVIQEADADRLLDTCIRMWEQTKPYDES